MPDPMVPAGPAVVVGVGTDLVDVGRMRTAMARTPGLATRVFTDAERSWAAAARRPEQRFAARFAAKEAVLKSMGAGLGAAPLTDIEVVRHDSGAPAVALHGRAAELARSVGVERILVSLTHTEHAASAVAVALGAPVAGPAGAEPGSEGDA